MAKSQVDKNKLPTAFFLHKAMRTIPKNNFKSLLKWIVIFTVMCIFTVISIKLMNGPGKQRLLKSNRVINYVIQTEECERDANIYMVVLVGSHPDHSEVRNAIRQTWGNPRLKNYGFKLVFLFGMVTNSIQQARLQAEHGQFGDILTGDFLDSYHNITLRDVMGLKWAAQHCHHARYILRADDDIALNIYKIIMNLERYYSKSTNLMACFAIITKAITRRKGRYAISYEEYPGQVYPDYCDGWAYVLTPGVAQQIVKANAQRRPIWINDVYITGILVEDLSLKHKLLHLSYTYSYDEMKSLAQHLNTGSDSDFKYDLGPVQQDVTLLMKLQEVYKRRAIRKKFINEFE